MLRRFVPLCAMLLWFWTQPGSLMAQHPLYLVNDNTEVRGFSFRFPETRTLSVERMREEIYTQPPTTMDRLRDALPLFSGRNYPFSPLELQRDVVRLRRFYERNGFLHTRIDYPASQLDTTSNTIHVIFTIWEGPPLQIVNYDFVEPGGNYALTAFADGEEREAWIRFRDRLGLRVGSRYTDFERTRVQDEVLSWLMDRGYAFARVDYEVAIDTLANMVDLTFTIDPGPIAYVSDIIVEGVETVHPRVVTRELSLNVGDRFSQSALIQGQRRLFALNLFRVALADVPEQPVGSSVTIRYRVREARTRHFSAQSGYGRNGGIQGQADWRHRNFLGGARHLTISVGGRSGWLRLPTSAMFDETRSLTTSISLRQPHLLAPRLSGTITPFYTWQQSAAQRIEFQEIGATSAVFYEFMPFRVGRIEYTTTRAIPLGDTDLSVTDPTEVDDIGSINQLEIYDRSVLRLAGTFGRADTYVEPTNGFLFRPLVEQGGVVFGSGLQYYKASGDLAMYRSIGPSRYLAGRVNAGRIWPFGASADQVDPETRYRFMRIRYFAGGASDVRGWAPGRLGPEVPRARLRLNDEGNFRLDSDNPDTPDAPPAISIDRIRYQAVGGLAKIVLSTELRSAIPGMNSNWQGAVFVDAGRIFPMQSTMLSPDVPNATIGFEESRFRVGTGIGFRYRTPVGAFRIDLAMKLNPSRTDLQRPGEVFRYRYQEDLRRLNPLEPEHPYPSSSIWRRFQIHLSLGQAY
jgi:outer membrane protein insertion porin family